MRRTEAAALTDAELLDEYVDMRDHRAAARALVAARNAARARDTLAAHVRTLADVGLPAQVIADRIGVHRSTVHRMIRAEARDGAE